MTNKPPYHIHFTEDKRSQYAGYADFWLHSPDGTHTIELKYKGEPPHGDSYHEVLVDGSRLPGQAWGGTFGFSRCSRFAAFSWMAKHFERRTMVVDMQARRYFLLPIYFNAALIDWPGIVEAISKDDKRYEFDGSENWVGY